MCWAEMLSAQLNPKAWTEIPQQLYYTSPLTSQFYSPTMLQGGLRGEMVKGMDCRIVVNEFELQSRYYINFRWNTFGKGMNPLILPAMG